MIRLILLTLTTVALSGSATTAEPEKLTQAEVEDLVYQSWKEERYEYNGLVLDRPAQLEGHRFKRDEYHSWPRGGELTGVGSESDMWVVVDAKADPIRLDIVYRYKGEEKKRVSPGIVKFEKGKMIWIKAGVEEKSELFREDGEYKTRPTGFEADKKNHYVKRIMVPCKYLEE